MTPTIPDLRPDDFRPYTLPGSLETAIPTRSVHGEPGIHWIARGLIVETSAQLLGRPIRLDLLDHPHTVFIHALISVLDCPGRRTARRPHHRRAHRRQAGQPLGPHRRQPPPWPRDQRPVPGSAPTTEASCLPAA